MYDYRGIDGTGTASSPASGSNQVSYVIRKLADGNCWMTDNLKLTLSTSHSYEVATFSGGTASWTLDNITNTRCTGNVCWYSWYVATGGQGVNTSNAPSITRSICPKGWKLPNGGSNSAPSFQSIVSTYSATTYAKITGLPLSYTAHGLYAYGNNETDNGFYWSASPYTQNSSNAYQLMFTPSRVYPQHYDTYSRFDGMSVRCVAIP